MSRWRLEADESFPLTAGSSLTASGSEGFAAALKAKEESGGSTGGSLKTSKGEGALTRAMGPAEMSS